MSMVYDFFVCTKLSNFKYLFIIKLEFFCINCIQIINLKKIQIYPIYSTPSWHYLIQVLVCVPQSLGELTLRHYTFMLEGLKVGNIINQPIIALPLLNSGANIFLAN